MIFLSYARDDNSTVTDEAKGWVSFLYAALEVEFREWGLDESPLWRDKRDVQQFEQFEKEIEDALRSAALMVAVLSPAYVQRRWCMEELARFSDLVGLETPEKRERIFKVVKRAVDEEPEQLRGQEGYRFYAFDQENNREVPFYHPGRGAEDRYWDVVRALAADLTAQLRHRASQRVEDTPDTALPGRTVYLAYTSSDMAAEARRIRGELETAGLRVLPEHDDRPPLTEGRLAGELRASLSEAEFSVHLLGETPGMVPEGTTSPITVIQLKAAEDAGRPRIIWAPATKQRDRVMKSFVSGLGAGEGMTTRDELIEEGFDRMKGYLRSLIEAPVTSQEASPSPDILSQIASMSPEQLDALKKLLDRG